MTRHFRQLGVVALLVAGAVVLVGCGGGEDAPSDDGAADGLPLRVTLEIDGSAFDAGEAIAATVTLTNRSDETLTVLRPFRVPSPVIFIVIDADGKEAGYEGLFGDRKPHAADRFVELEPGNATDGEFNLADGYYLPAGEYTVIARYSNADDGADHGLAALLTGDDDFDSTPVTIEVK